MTDTFKGIITADGKKRQLSYGDVLETPASDATLSLEGAFADAKVVGDKFKEVKTETNSLKEDLSNKITKFYASSQGETHLADSDNGKIMDMMLYGRSEQKQYRGKNLLPTTMYSDSTVRNGITFINNGDGSVTAKGTSTDITFFDLWGFNVIADKGILPGLKAGDTVYVSDCLLQETNSKELLKSTTNGTATINSSTTTMYVAIRVSKGATVNKTYYPQIEKGSEFTSYEPYVGGQPSPSPDYPQEINSVVNPTVKLSNEDGTQFKTLTLPYTLNAIPVSSDGNITINGQQYIADYVDVEKGKLYRKVKRLNLKDVDDIRIAHGFHSNGNGYLSFGAENIKKGSQPISNRYKSSAWTDKSGYTYIPSSNDIIFVDDRFTDRQTAIKLVQDTCVIYALSSQTEEDLSPEQIKSLKSLSTYYPITNISVNSEQLDGYTVFNYPISIANGWNYVKKQLNDNRDYIYDMDMQSAEAYVNSEYAVTLTELEV